jgi:type II secretory pathway pseudopilin PulG
MLIQLQTSGDITADEIRNSLWGEGEFSFDVKLDKKEWDKQKKLAQEQADAQAQQQQQQFGGGEQQGYDPNDYFGDQGTEQPQENLDSTLIDRIYMDASDRFVDLKAPFAQMWIKDQKRKLLQK